MSLLVGGLLAIGHIAISAPRLSAVGAGRYALVYGVAYVGVAVAEEMLFRGYLQTTLARIVGFWPAALVLSLAFALAHLGNANESTLGAVNAGLIGLMLCFCLRVTGSLWWGIGFHTTWNWSEAFLYGLPASGFTAQGRLWESAPAGNAIWSGGAAGLESSALVLPIVGLAVLIIVRTFGRSRANFTA